MMHIPHLSFYVTSKCNNRCRYCATAGVRRNYPQYHMTLCEVEDFLDALTEHDVTIGRIGITGGEPLLWPDLLPAVWMLKQSRRVRNVRILTNGKLLHTFSAKQLRDIDGIRISVVNRSIARLYMRQRKRLGRKVSFESHLKFTIFPRKYISKLVQEAWPARCRCFFPTYYNWQLFVCGGVLLESSQNDLIHVPEWASAAITDENPFRVVGDRRAFNMMACTACLANAGMHFKKELWSSEHEDG